MTKSMRNFAEKSCHFAVVPVRFTTCLGEKGQTGTKITFLVLAHNTFLCRTLLFIFISSNSICCSTYVRVSIFQDQLNLRSETYKKNCTVQYLVQRKYADYYPNTPLVTIPYKFAMRKNSLIHR